MKTHITFYLTLFLLLVLAACTAATDAPLDAPTSSDETPSYTPEPPAATGEQLIQEAQILDVDVRVLESFPVQIHVGVTGVLADACTSFASAEVTRTDDTFVVTVYTTRPADRMCAQVVSQFTEVVPLDVVGLPAGTYAVEVNGVRGSFTLTMDNG